jgi:hypothetical protein
MLQVIRSPKIYDVCNAVFRIADHPRRIIEPSCNCAVQAIIAHAHRPRLWR